jgi:hypothetical protein
VAVGLALALGATEADGDADGEDEDDGEDDGAGTCEPLAVAEGPGIEAARFRAAEPARFQLTAPTPMATAMNRTSPRSLPRDRSRGRPGREGPGSITPAGSLIS